MRPRSACHPRFFASSAGASSLTTSSRSAVTAPVGSIEAEQGARRDGLALEPDSPTSARHSPGAIAERHVVDDGVPRLRAARSARGRRSAGSRRTDSESFAHE